MDPNLVLRVLELALELANKVWDATPKERQVEGIERCYKFWDTLEAFLRTGELPGKLVEAVPFPGAGIYVVEGPVVPGQPT